jgi:hypothetical protein
MQVGLRRAINDGAIVVKRVPGITHLNLRQVAGRRIWRVLKRWNGMDVLLTSDGPVRYSLLEWQRLVSISLMKSAILCSKQVLIQVIRRLHVQLGWHLLLSFSVSIHYTLLVLISKASSTHGILEYLRLNPCHAWWLRRLDCLVFGPVVYFQRNFV